jgi:hypothetical protein
MKKLKRKPMMKWIEDKLIKYNQEQSFWRPFVRETEDFNGEEGGIWLSGEDMSEYKGQTIYSYYSFDYKNREFGVLDKWENELKKRGWYSQWYDTGTIMLYELDC